ncbi:hypothetical protein BCR34DRAFT_589459 [Clohesyomyces aquaticus]|uniref:Uncharacterized protein n=1 Tax=Clohesyomyces aquaticus TaxID=1231657 RepID=A0A1Y1ZHD2_9PLEO|nr:hypothetical protein BCR34DRAFT_589459 [Clohesyomyces aquaticus]
MKVWTPGNNKRAQPPTKENWTEWTAKVWEEYLAEYIAEYPDYKPPYGPRTSPPRKRDGLRRQNAGASSGRSSRPADWLRMSNKQKSRHRTEEENRVYRNKQKEWERQEKREKEMTIVAERKASEILGESNGGAQSQQYGKNKEWYQDEDDGEFDEDKIKKQFDENEEIERRRESDEEASR